MEINAGQIITNELSKNAKGGSELMGQRLVDSLPQELLRDFQIILSRVRTLDESKIRIYWAHDLDGDPEAANALANEGWRRFHKIVFVSNWQMQNFINTYQIPYSHCVVLRNAINPIQPHEKPDNRINLAYWTTPHRGLHILVPVFQKLCEKHDNIHLNVYSSFKVYGWEERDAQFADLFGICSNDPKISNHGAVSNSEIRSALEQIHILAYPSTWVETSCLTLMEAMSAGCVAVHSNLGALFETGANWTQMYQFHENPNDHAQLFYANLDRAIEDLNSEATQSRISAQKTYADVFYSWPIRSNQWIQLLKSFDLSADRAIPEKKEYFTFKTS